MHKKIIRTIGATILLILFICTIVSLKNYEKLITEVSITLGEDLSERERAFPISCYNEENGTFFCVEKRQGDFREEYAIEEEEVVVIRIEDDKIVIAGDIFYTRDFGKPMVIYESSKPVQDGDIVKIIQQK